MNERLRTAIIERGLTLEELAEACSVDPKTVSRWVGGRIPHRRHRWAVSQQLDRDETYLWPEQPKSPSENERPALAPFINRASVPRDLWLSLLRDATQQIDVLVFSGTFFAQTNPQIARMLRQRATAGVQIRLCFGDPTGQAVVTRGVEEGIGDTLAAKIRASLTYYRDLIGTPGCEIRLHDTTLYNSLFRYDDHLLVNPHIWGQPASANPILQLHRTAHTEWFESYTMSFDAVWKTARPWAPDHKEQ
ncbi:helix-turn-helix transcriptional regulator [Streptomyces sp. TRM66268-LWL]|uniref:Helix-turn-helix transcriptional regulator n=1 Tax=Streptomyces polyasparticus TaxID=2767826 RepID=A0ABR7SR58_9ACTN|nr:helix-turn-helix transcriptional regulator [Streptomyces polyasparticus]MBC9717996.1 helix-turn-helix transcriptional regulator [Streptomyces polyasparticus]